MGRMGRPGQGLVSPGCPVCHRSVFPMEAVMAADRTPYHKFCLKCNECGRKLDIGNLNEHEKSSTAAPVTRPYFERTVISLSTTVERCRCSLWVASTIRRRHSNWRQNPNTGDGRRQYLPLKE